MPGMFESIAMTTVPVVSESIADFCESLVQRR